MQIGANQLAACGRDETHVPSHVKFTRHFQETAWSRGLTGAMAAAVMAFVIDGTLCQLASRLPTGERGAIALADAGVTGAVVFCRDAEDPSVLAVLTFLGEGEVKVLARRRDTRLMTL